jgi:hypothetical protein
MYLSRVFLQLFALCILGAFILICPASAQFGQDLLSGSVFSTALRSGDAMRRWYQQHGTFPTSDTDVDNALRYVYSQITGSPVEPDKRIVYTGNVHCIGNLRLCMDPTVRDAPIEQWRNTPPESWHAPANSIVILTDGGNQFLIWVSVINGVPLRDADNRCMFIYDKLTPPQE